MRSLGGNHKKHDVLTDSFFRILVSLGLPICISNFVTLFTTTLVNNIYSESVGQMGFSVMGAVNMALSMGSQILGSMALAAWIKGADNYGGMSGKKVGLYSLNAVYTLLFVAFCAIIVLLLGQSVIFRVLNVPVDILEESRGYYRIYIWSYLFYGTATFLSYINNARGSSKAVLLSNLLSPCSLVAFAFLYLKVLKMDVNGVAFAVVSQYLMMTVVNYILLRKQGILGTTKVVGKQWIPEGGIITKVLRYGLLLAAQIMLCSVAEIVISIQTNRYLSLEYIAVIAVTLPIQGFFTVIVAMCTAFVPQNYMAGKTARLKSFMWKLFLLSLGYAVVCFAIYAFGGKWYFGRLFEDTAIAALGAEYWFWYGLSIIPLSLVYVFRFFFDAVGKGKVSMLSGIGELVGRLVCGLWLIPVFGNIGGYLAPLIGWGTGGLLMVSAYGVLQKGIYRKCDEIARNKDME